MRALPSLRQLQYLVELAKRRNFTRAAEACFVTQSTLSAGLKELESLLGTQLVERDRQSVRMTPAGDMAVTRARVLLAAADDLVEAAAAATPMSGTVKLGVIPTVAPFLLPGLLAAMRHRSPRLRLALREDLTANLMTRLGEGALDFALIALPWDTTGLLVRELFGDELWLVAPEKDPALAARHLVVTPAMTERLLILEEGHCLREHALQACGESAVVRPGGVEATSLLTLVEMVDAGMGISLVPELALKGGVLKMTRLVARPLAAPAPRRIIALVARRSTARTEEFQSIADCTIELQQRRMAAAMPSTARRARRPDGHRTA